CSRSALSGFFYLSLLYCYVAVLDLHSFPTRRSSDLDHFVIALLFLLGGISYTYSNFIKSLNVDLSYPWAKPVVIIVLLVMLQFGDRKSTRLNSSHVSISYAVFCLKQKKDEHIED